MMGKKNLLTVQLKWETDEWQDWLIDENLDQELALSQQQEFDERKELLYSSIIF